MLSAGVWELNQANTILFVMVDSSGVEVTGLGAGFTLQISKGGAAFAGSAGTKSEVGSGWYKYVATAGEADTPGPVAVKVTGSGAVQQNMEYVILSRTISAVEFTYTVTDSVSGDPLPGVDVWICTDILGTDVVWHGVTDASGIARDSNDSLPRLDPGTYQIFRNLSGYSFSDPDSETVQ